MDISTDLLKIEYPSGQVAYLSASLVKRQKLTHHALLRLRELHLKKDALYRQMRSIVPDNPQSLLALKRLDKEVTENEFELQRTWGFVPTETMHPWYDVPHCTCPKVDNQDLRGTPHRIISQECPIHT